MLEPVQKRACLVLTLVPVLGLWLKTADPATPEFDRAAGIRFMETLLQANGLRRSHASKLEISAQTAGVVFNRVGCEGALIVVPLPPTAQSFEQVLAGFNSDVAHSGFVYRSMRYPSYPHLARSVDRVRYILRFPDTLRGPMHSIVYAYRELGPCGILSDVNWRLNTLKGDRPNVQNRF
jgi:hypothetical protein